MKIACIGIGAVGSIIARELKKTDLEVDLYSRTGSTGFTILENDEYTTYDYTIHTVEDARNIEYDIIFIATKATALNHLKEIIPGISHDATEVILCQNGMGFDSWFENSVPGVVYISGQKKGDHIEHFRDSKLIIQEEKYRYIDELIKLIREDGNIGLEIIKDFDFEKLRYEKLLINLGVNTMTALSQNTARIFRDGDVTALTGKLLREGQAVLNRNTEIITDGFIDEALKLFQSYPDHMGTSMYYDVMNKTETEYAFIQQYFYDHRENLETPVLEVVCTLLKAYSIGKARN